MDDSSQINRVAREMIERFGDGAAQVARKLAEVSDEVQDEMLTSSQTWREIADAIERLRSNYGQAQRSIIC
jgi:DNA repair exonuclease SbcCD ATPase subunit